MSDTPIFNSVGKIALSGSSRFCMPGHKGKSFPPGGDINKYDITELPGADNLYCPSDAILKAEKRYAEYIEAKDGFFLVNGSSGGVQAAVLSALKPDDEILAVRDFHLSAPHAFALAGVTVHFIFTGLNSSGMFNIVNAGDIKRAFKEHPNSKALYLTYPDYWGRCAHLNEICRTAHGLGLKVICDAAHAAAFDYSDLLPQSPAKAGCDIWTASLHKTLPAMNQCAVLCTGAESGFERSAVQSKINLIQTTSPSYILLSSSDCALDYMRKNGTEKLAGVIGCIKECENEIDNLGGYACLSHEYESDKSVYSYDILKLAIDVSQRHLTGFKAAEELEKEGIYVEAADLNRFLLLCSVADDKTDFERLIHALEKIKGFKEDVKTDFKEFDLTRIFNEKFEISIRDAVFARRKRRLIKDAAEKISSVCIGAYPPGVPIILPGQRISKEALGYLERMKSAGYSLFGMTETVETVAE